MQYSVVVILVAGARLPNKMFLEPVCVQKDLFANLQLDYQIIYANCCSAFYLYPIYIHIRSFSCKIYEINVEIIETSALNSKIHSWAARFLVFQQPIL